MNTQKTTTVGKITIGFIIAIVLDVIFHFIGGREASFYLFFGGLTVNTRVFFTEMVICYLATYYFLKILTNDNKMILVPASIAIAFSAGLLFGANIISFTFLQCALIIVNELTKNKIVKKDSKEQDNKTKKILLAVLLIICICASMGFANIVKYDLLSNKGTLIASDTLVSRSFNVVFLYIFFFMSLWLLLKNKNNVKIMPVVIIVICIILAVAGIVYFTNNMFLGAVDKNAKAVLVEGTKGNGLSWLFGYMFNVVEPFVSIEGLDWSPAFTIVSVFPIPLIIGMWYLFKNDKHEEFLFPMMVGITLATVFAIMENRLPEILQVITFTKWVNTADWVFMVGLLGLYVVFYLISNTEEKMFDIIPAIRLTMIVLILTVFIPLPNALASRNMRTIYCVVFTILAFLTVQYGANKKYKKVCTWCIALTTLVETGILLFSAI